MLLLGLALGVASAAAQLNVTGVAEDEQCVQQLSQQLSQRCGGNCLLAVVKMQAGAEWRMGQEGGRAHRKLHVSSGGLQARRRRPAPAELN